MPKKVAFLRMRHVPHANETMVCVLQEIFPDFEIDVIEVIDLVLKRKDIVFINFFFVLKEYGLKILLGKRKPQRSFFVTTYIFKKIRSLLSARISKSEYAFTFQMQSLFDGHIKGLPHFVYTDHTVLAHLYYPDIDPTDYLLADSWIELEKEIYQNAALVFTRSTNVTKSIVEQYGVDSSRVVCVYAGSNVNVNCAKMDNDDYRNQNILFVGVDWERKGGPELVEAFKQVLEIYPQAQLTIVGYSPAVHLPNCHVFGRISLEEVNRHYRQASLFCMPTKLEPFGIAFIEALAHKLPVVATNIGAIPEFIVDGENGYLVEPNNLEQLTNALIDLLGNPEKGRRFGEKGYRLVKERYSWEKVGQLIKQNIVPLIDEA